MQSQKIPSKTKAIEKCKKDKRLLRKKIEQEEQKTIEKEEDEDQEDDIEDSEEETESEINTPQSLNNLSQNTSLELTNSSQTESIQRSSMESSEMMVQEPTVSNSKQADKENSTPSFYIGQDQIEQSPEANSSSSSSSDSSQSSSEGDIGEEDDDIMGFVGGQFDDEDDFYDIDDDDDDDEFDIETNFDMESQKLRTSIEEARIKAMMEKSLPNPFSAQSIISQMRKMIKINQVNNKYLSDLNKEKAKKPNERKLFFDQIIMIKAFKKQQQPFVIVDKLQKIEGLNSNQKNPTHRVLAQQRLWHQLKNNANAHALFDQYLRQTTKNQSTNQVRFPINLGPINRNTVSNSRKPNMILRSQLRPVQKPVELKTMSITDVVQSQNIELLSNKQTHNFTLQGGKQIQVIERGEGDIITHVNAMQVEIKPNMSDQIEKTKIQIPLSLADGREFNAEDESYKDSVACESFQENIIDKVLVDS